MSSAYATRVAKFNQQPILKHAVLIAAIAAISACGGGGDSTPAVSGGSSAVASGSAVTGTSGADITNLNAAGATVRVTASQVKITASGDGSATVKVTPEGGNLVVLQGSWADSAGTAQPTAFDGSTGYLTVPAGATLYTRTTQPLVAGTQYMVTADASAVGAEVTLYLINSANQVLKINGQTITQPDSATFTAPADVKGFYIGVKNPTGAPILAVPDLRGVPAATGGSGQTTTPPGGPITGVLPLDPTQQSAPVNDDLRPAEFTVLVPEVSDEFNSTELDRSKWCTRMPWGNGSPLQIPDAECTKWPSMGVGDFAQEQENQRFREINSLGEPLHVVSEGSLKLRATATSTRQYQPYESSAIRSKFVFKPTGTEKYYIASRVFMPEIKGTLPTIWLNPGLDASPDSGPGGIPQTVPEIDIFEGALNYEAEDQFSMHQGTQVKGAQTASGTQEYTYTHPRYNRQWQYWDGTDVGVNLRDQWVRMGTEWSANEVCFYLEGLKTNCQRYKWVINEGAPANPATLIAYYAIGGNWAGRAGIDTTKFPSAFEIDYLRVYKTAD